MRFSDVLIAEVKGDSEARELLARLEQRSLSDEGVVLVVSCKPALMVNDRLLH